MKLDRNIYWYGLLAILLFMGFFYGMTAYAIHDNNEGLYTEIAREMLISGHYIIPHLNGVPYLEKPPLLYWAIMRSYQIFGVNEFAARLVPSLASTITCLSVFGFCHAIGKKRVGLVAALILASSIGFIIIGRVIFFDMLLTCCLTLSLLLFYLWYQNHKNHYLILSYFFLSLAFLTKGLIGVVVAASVALLLLFITGSWRAKLKPFFNPLGLLVFFAISGSWLLMACKALPQFAWDFFINENWYRFLGKRIPKDYYHGPIYYYLPRLFVYLFPWLFLFPSLFGKIKRPVDPLKLFLCLWFLIPMLIFSTGSDKGNYYMIIAMPALAILLALKIDEWLTSNTSKWLIILFGSAALITVIALVASYYAPNSFPEMQHFTMMLAIATTLYTALAAGLLWRYRSASLAFFLITLLILPYEFYGIRLLIARDNTDSQVDLTNYILQHHPERPLYLWKNYEELSSVLYYLQRPIPIVDSASRDLYFGSHTPEAAGHFVTQAEFIALAEHQPIYVILTKGRLGQFYFYTPVRFCVVASSVHADLLTNDLKDCQQH